jgi:cellulose biosynthesis protein BcsQ
MRAAVVMFKGGVAKSTVAATVGVGLARQGRRVLVVDLDAQMSATHLLGKGDHDSPGVVGVLMNAIHPTKAIIPVLNLNAMTYATEIWLPVSMDYLSLVGVGQVLEAVRLVKEELGHHIPIRRVIPTMVDTRTRRARDIVAALKETFDGRVTSPIRASTRVSESARAGRVVLDFAPRATGAADFDGLIRRINQEID